MKLTGLAGAAASVAIAASALADGPATTNYLADGSIVYTFTNTTATTWTVPYSGSSDILLVGGGGGGGSATGGGGGGGGVLYRTAVPLAAGSVLTVEVGAGGASNESGSGSSITELFLEAPGGGRGGTI